MKQSSKSFIITILAVLSLVALPACGLVDSIMEKAGYTKDEPVQRNRKSPLQESESAEQILATEPASEEYVFTGVGDAALAEKADTFMNALHNGDITTSWDLLKYYQQAFGDDQAAWASWAESHQFESWTINSAEWDGQGAGGVTGVATLGSTTYDFSLIYQLIIGDNISEDMIIDMSFRPR